MGNLRDGEVDNGGVLLHKEVVLGEALDAEDQVGGQFGQLELLEEILFVGFVLLQERDTHTHTDHVSNQMRPEMFEPMEHISTQEEGKFICSIKPPS